MPIIGVIDSSKSGNLTPTAGYISLASVLVTSNTPTIITFSSIPATYKHLEIRGHLNENVTNNNAFFRIYFNNDTTAANYISQATRS